MCLVHLTFEFSGVAKAQLLRSPLNEIVMPHCTWRALQVEKIAQGEPLLFLWVKREVCNKRFNHWVSILFFSANMDKNAL